MKLETQFAHDADDFDPVVKGFEELAPGTPELNLDAARIVLDRIIDVILYIKPNAVGRKNLCFLHLVSSCFDEFHRIVNNPHVPSNCGY